MKALWIVEDENEDENEDEDEDENEDENDNNTRKTGHATSLRISITTVDTVNLLSAHG